MTSITVTDGASREGGGNSLLYDPKARGLLFQALLLIAVVAFFAWIVENTVTNLAEQNKRSGFGFLEETSGFQILTTLGTYFIESRPGRATYLDVFWIGVINTLIVAVTGIVAATILGFVMGVFRLSSNIVLSTFATVYVELLRNIPLLLQILFFYIVTLRALPWPRDEPLGATSFGLNITGLYAPFPVTSAGFSTVMWALLAGLALAWLLGWLADRQQAATGQRFPAFWLGLAAIVILPLVAYYLTDRPLTWEQPEFRTDGPVLRRGYQDGVGMVIKPEFIALWLALSLYTASFIAEIVRAGILAVPSGQTEAAYALGIRPNVTLRQVIIPQAMRVIIPPLTSQFLNLTKNSSLAVAIAYPDVVSVFAGTALNQVGQEIEMIVMMMLVYLVFSLGTSAFMNWFNDRVALVER